MIRTFRANTGSLAAGATLTLTPANFTIAPEDVAYLRLLCVSGGITLSGARINVVSDIMPAGVDFYPVGQMEFPIYYDPREDRFVGYVVLNGRTIITVTNDSAGAISALHCSAMIEIVEKAQNYD